MSVGRPVTTDPSQTPLSSSGSGFGLLPPLLRRLLTGGILSADAWEKIPLSARTAALSSPTDDALTDRLTQAGLLTPYQAERVKAGELPGLSLGNYRVLDKVGAGGMGVVFRAEHHRLRQPVAIKALMVSAEKNRRALDRFFQEVQAVTRLKHPHIVAAIDAGEEPAAGPDGRPVPYLVMEYVEGRNLEDLVAADGPLPIEQACLLAHQVADALTEAHRHGVIHRDVKPGNVIVSAEGTAKLLDFGVARLPSPDDRLTKDGARLGTIGYMAPEQVRNPRDVDPRADVFGLGATLYFMLTGRDPFDPPAGSAGALRVPPARPARPEVTPQLDAVLARLMALTPAERVASAEAAMRELMPFLTTITRAGRPVVPTERSPGLADATPAPHRILIVDDQTDVRRVCRLALAGEGAKCDEVGTGTDAVAHIGKTEYDLILLDVDLPGCSGEEVLNRVRRAPPSPYLKVIMLSGRTSGDELSRMLAAGADDFLTKPFSLVQLRARVKAALKLKDAQDRSELLNRHMQTLNAELERTVSMKDGELLHARGAMVLALAKLVEQRSAETGAHLIRLQKYSRVLADTAAASPSYAQRFDPYFIQALVDAAPLHDIGKSAVPDHILNKPGKLTPEERVRMESHAVIGAETLQEVARRYRFATGFLQMAIDLARHHHERWDGAGYPDRLAGEDIPLAARLLAICDVYDALRSKRAYKPSLSHNMAVMTMCESSLGHFDPGLLSVFHGCAGQFDQIFRETGD
jgi:response regulator RpfG family c-di-GMP phosphodiesterase